MSTPLLPLSKKKSIPRARIEEDLHDLLQNVAPTKNTLDIATAMMGDVFNARQDELRHAAQSAYKQLKDLEANKETLLDRISSAKNLTLTEAYERRLLALESQGPILRKKRPFLHLAMPRKPVILNSRSNSSLTPVNIPRWHICGEAAGRKTGL